MRRRLRSRPHPIRPRMGRAGRVAAGSEHPRPSRAPLLLILLLVLLPAACEPGEAGRDGVVEHPIPDSLATHPDQAVVVPADPDAPAPEAARAFGSLLLGHTVLQTIGVEDGPDEYVLGDIADARLLPDGTVGVVDRQAAEVRFYDPAGSHLSSLGGPGEGPGEFSHPSLLLVPSPARLWVMDPPRGIHRFSPGAEGWEFQDRLTLEGRPGHGCTSAGGVVVHMGLPSPDAEPGPVLHRLDGDGQSVDAFALPYRYDYWLVRERMNQGVIACPEGDTTILGLTAMNRVEAYSANEGRLLWHATFEGMAVPPVEERPRPEGEPGVGLQRPDGPVVHTLTGVTAVADAPVVVVQFARQSVEDLEAGVARPSFETFVLDVHAGEGTYLGDTLPRILWAGGDRALFASADPYPRIKLVALGTD